MEVPNREKFKLILEKYKALTEEEKSDFAKKHQQV